EETDDETVRGLEHVISEAAAILVTGRKIDREPNAAITVIEVDGLLGQHPRLNGRKLTLRIDEFLERLGAFKHERVPGYEHYRQVRGQLVERERRRLRIGEFKPQVLSAFVRNRLINEV